MAETESTPEVSDKDLTRLMALSLTARYQPPPMIPVWLTPLLQGITLVGLLGFAFWVGSVSTTVNSTAETVKELSAAKEQITNRLTAIETKLNAVGNATDKIDKIEAKLDAMDKKLDQRKPMGAR